MQTSDFDYVLPPERIAQTPASPRDHSRLLVLGRKTGDIQHRHFYDIGEFLRPGDLLVVNESKVFKARLRTTAGIEIFLLRPEGKAWLALAKPGRKIILASTVTFSDRTTCHVIDKKDDGTVVLDFDKPADEIFAWADRVGEVPTPPYVEKPPADADKTYQTVYAKTVGSVAAPTAGFHFTPELIEKLKTKGIHFATVTLHVGLGTFRPMKTETLEEHQMHEEWIDVPDETLNAIEETKKNGGRVIAIGTTTVRALESGVKQGFTNVFITPGYQFKYIDGLVTNFHLPKSTLLVLVSAFAGRENILHAYHEAIAREYRFYSFGDAMLII
ncbi:MAG: tRNA preQ1(34) S-adenosylmethionine ribosyltransferase-isomerase QueA [Patescibacteria group bacterium]